MLWSFVLGMIMTIILNLFITYYILNEIPNGFISSILSIGTFLFLFIMSFFLLTRPIMQYFRAITHGLNAIAGGDLGYRLPLTRLDELGTVAQNINNMAERLQLQVERERYLEKSKMELITSVSHDLRTPLTSIIGYLDLLKTHAYQDVQEQERYIDHACNKIQQLNKLVNDLFEYTRLTSGEVRLSLQEVDLNQVLEQMISEFEPVAREHGISIHKSLPPVPVKIIMDVEKIVRAIDNLFWNAIKFSERPSELRITLLTQEDSIIIAVENDGKPISQEVEEQLFERFFKGEPSRNDKNMPSGSGLGLSIAKHIVELHEGRIWLEHDNGHFKFCIELQSS
ncbi:hypothetical protein Back11_30040 [Paenibacillus baekrokdamisoli]|uniref:histidine kinase n=3 Tax=Paenibacillus baekrokdamisoli TaxID=1712516 RepID=A0A3G9JFB5_9BACL|nr:hypothetical protein Back11_30040 [Paenibacillus baekrokdamisoli]